jgi:hypothetical protein
MKIAAITIAVGIVVGVIAYTQLTFFVIQPIGALPEGKTLLIHRLGALNFVDSPDALCARLMGGVSLLCRGMAMAKVLDGATIYARLPYSRTLYQISTGGAQYER